jgi:hypothetical protein
VTVARVYATLAQLTAYAPAGTTLPVEPEATRILTSASAFLERATMTAVYPTDTLGYPSDTAIRQAFQDAACAQALFWLPGGGGDEQGVSGRYQTVSIGSVTLSKGGQKGGHTSGTQGQELAPMAETVLRTAGVLPGSLVQIRTWEGGWL